MSCDDRRTRWLHSLKSDFYNYDNTKKKLKRSLCKLDGTTFSILALALPQSEIFCATFTLEISLSSISPFTLGVTIIFWKARPTFLRVTIFIMYSRVKRYQNDSGNFFLLLKYRFRNAKLVKPNIFTILLIFLKLNNYDFFRA